MGADFLAAKSGHRREKQPLLGLVILYDPKITERALERGWVPKVSQVYDQGLNQETFGQELMQWPMVKALDSQSLGLDVSLAPRSAQLFILPQSMK